MKSVNAATAVAIQLKERQEPSNGLPDMQVNVENKPHSLFRGYVAHHPAE